MTSIKKHWAALSFSSLLLAVASSLSHAEDSGPTINGFVDTTYSYNFNKPNTGLNAYRSFDSRDNNISLNAAQLAITGTLGDAGYVIKMLAGTDAAVITPATVSPSGTSSFANNNVEFDVQEAFMTYQCPRSKIVSRIGKFATTMGIELIESKDNPNITRGFLFGLAEPYTHTGLMLSRAFGVIDIGAGVVNGWDLVNDNNKSKTILGKVGLNFGDPLTVTVSASHGPEQANIPRVSSFTASVEGNNRDSFDITAVTKIIPRVALWLQANVGSEDNITTDPISGELERDSWDGFGIQPIISFTDKFSLGARAEYFHNDQGSRVGGVRDLAMVNYSITPGYKFTEHTQVRAEYRYDTANEKVFVDDEAVAKETQSTATLQFLVTF